MHPVLNGILGGWQLNGVWRFAGGRPILLGLDSSTPIPTFGQRANLTGPLQVNHSSKASMISNYFANACESEPCPNGGPSVVGQPDAYNLCSAPPKNTNNPPPGNKKNKTSLYK